MKKHLEKAPPQYICLKNEQKILFCIVFIFLFVFPLFLKSQTTYSTFQLDSLRSRSFGETLELNAQNAENSDVNAFDPTDGIEQLRHLFLNNLDLNKATRTDFEQLKPLLTDVQIDQILWHRARAGDFAAVEELQAVAALDIETIRKILPFVTLQMRPPVKPVEQNIWLRWARRLESARGYDSEVKNGYLGDPNQLFLRYHYQKSNAISLNFVAEKDAGEPLFKGKNKQGFDFYSFHAAFDFPKWHTKPRIVLGDFSINFAQGLTIFNGFALGKSSEILNIERNHQAMRPYSSVTETGFFRGIAANLQLSEHTAATIFASSKRIDANLTENPDPSPQTFLDSVIASSFSTAGLHRTQAELSDKNALRKSTFGATIQHAVGRRSRVGAQVAAQFFDKPILPSNEPYNLNAFRGKFLGAASVNYATNYQNIRLFGETAVTQTNGWASANGLAISLDKTLSVSILQRYFSEKYHNFDGNPFSESTNFRGESGIFLGANWAKNRRFRVQAYADFWRFSGIRFRVDGNSVGEEYFVKMTYSKKNLETYVSFRQKTRAENAFSRPDSVKINVVIPKTRQQIRWQFDHTPTPEISFATRLEWSQFLEKNPFLPNLARATGFLAFVEARFATPQYSGLQAVRWLRNWTTSARYAVFNTTDFNSAIYAYETDVINSFSVSPYFGRGTRVYWNLKYKFSYKTTIECRVARSFFPDQTQLGSGLETILGNRKTDFKLQMHHEF